MEACHGMFESGLPAGIVRSAPPPVAALQTLLVPKPRQRVLTGIRLRFTVAGGNTKRKTRKESIALNFSVRNVTVQA